MAEGAFEKFIENTELEDSIRKEFASLFQKLGDNLSSSHFDEFLHFSKGAKVLRKPDSAVEFFKSQLVEDLQVRFNKMWEFSGVGINLAILDFLKQRYKSSVKPQWRPSGKTPYEQTINLRVKMLKRKISYFEKQFDFQKEQLTNAIQEVEENRKHIADLLKRRDGLVDQVELGISQIPELKEKLKNLQLAVVDLY